MVSERDGRLRLRVLFEPGIVLGPGKADLLEGIRATGSISAAGRRMRMSYKRAWDLVVALNGYFDTPVVQTSKGGSGGGGASLTPFGEQVLAAYRRIEAKSAQVAADELAWLRDRLSHDGGAPS
ncbi:winged helix-turn-helix domain-containing protein [Luteimonas abyssi]|jgi:molybdate transport system regulatory protein|uniref:winged helix-turn-helix domain-containing protein n=1 Tax=Luteimonas abyssi TaxID=1247514 RepID=UPI000737C73C|nr:LysR family transcriptional regulator [Luteimonas abyssi]